MSTESKTRVPLAYVGYWPTAVAIERFRTCRGVNACFIENYPPGTLHAHFSGSKITDDIWRVELHWQASQPLSTAWSILDREGGNEVMRIPHSVMYGEVDTSDWDLHPLYTPIHDPVLDGSPPRG